MVVCNRDVEGINMYIGSLLHAMAREPGRLDKQDAPPALANPCLNLV